MECEMKFRGCRQFPQCECDAPPANLIRSIWATLSTGWQQVSEGGKLPFPINYKIYTTCAGEQATYLQAHPTVCLKQRPKDKMQ